MHKIILAILLFAAPVWATTRYVDGTAGACTGNYSIASRNCTGSDGNSYATVALGVSATSAADTLYIRAGTYAEDISTIPSGVNDGSRTLISGYLAETVWLRSITINSKNYVTVTKVNLNGAGLPTSYSDLYIGNSNYITFSYAEVKNAPWCTIATGTGGVGYGSYLLFDHLTVHDSGLQGAVGDIAHGLYVEASNVTVSNSEFYNNTQRSNSYGIHSYDTVKSSPSLVLTNNKSHSNSNGMLVGSGDDQLIYNNLVYNNSYEGIELGYRTFTNARIFNNTIYGNGDHGIQVGVSGNPQNVLIQNNIISSNAGSCVKVWYDGDGIISNNNCYGNGGGIVDLPGDFTVSSNITSDPLLISSSDFHLQSLSPVIGSGLNLYSTFTTDFEGTARPTSPTVWDIGAYVYAAPEPAEPPIVTTDSCTISGSTSLSCSGTVTHDGGGTITARGVAYGTSANPTIAGSHTTDGSGTGAFTSAITALELCTLYHIRTYATNSNSTTYGADVSVRPRGVCGTGDWTAVGGALVYDTSGGSSNSEGHTLPLTVSNQPNRVMMVGVAGYNSSVNSVQFDGVDATLIEAKVRSTTMASLYKIIDPNVGTHNLVVTHTDGSIEIGAVVYYGADTTGTPFGTQCSATDADYTTVTCNVSSGAGEVAIDVVAEQDSTPTAGTGQTRRWYKATAGHSGGMSTKDGSATITMSWSWTPSQYGAMVAIPIKPMASANWYTSTSVKPYAIKSGATLLTHVADDAACPASITGADQWCHVDSTDRIYVQVTGGGNPGAVTIQCSKPSTGGMMGLF